MKTLTNEDTRGKLHRQAKNAKPIVEIDDESEVDSMEGSQKTRGVRITKTGKTLDQEKMMKRKVENCDRKDFLL